MIYCACGGMILMGMCNGCGKENQMICYKDMTWCNMGGSCGATCYRKLTDEDYLLAEELRLPIAMTNMDNGCYEMVTKQDKGEHSE